MVRERKGKEMIKKRKEGKEGKGERRKELMGFNVWGKEKNWKQRKIWNREEWTDGHEEEVKGTICVRDRGRENIIKGRRIGKG